MQLVGRSNDRTVSIPAAVGSQYIFSGAGDPDHVEQEEIKILLLVENSGSRRRERVEGVHQVENSVAVGLCDGW